MSDEHEDRSSSEPTTPSEPVGSIVTPDGGDTQAEPSVTPNFTVSQTPKHRGHKLIMLLVLLLVAAGAVGYVSWSKSNNNSTNNKNVKKDIPYLTFGFSDTANITPNYPTETADSTDTAFIDAQLFEGLVRSQDQTKVIPALATSWSNPNDTTWVFNLQHGVTFHSGRTMTAADVKYSLDYAVAHQSDYANATNLVLANSITQVSEINPYKVQITTNGPDPVLLNRLAALYIIDSKAKLGDSNAGTGPYTVKPGSINKLNPISLDLVAFNGYWGGHVYTRQVHIQEEPTYDQLTNDTANGKFDMAGRFTNQQVAKIKEAQPKHYQTISVPDLGSTYLGLNTLKASSPLHSLAARQAATYALNIPTILKAGALSGTIASQLIPSTIPGYDPSIHNIPYNPTKAKQLLAGVPNLSAPLTLSYPTGDDAQVAEIAKELNAVGFNVKTSLVSDFNSFVNLTIAGQTDMFYVSYTTNTLDGLDIINNTAAGTQNYSSTELNSLIQQASSTFDATPRIAILQKIEQLVANDIPDIPLYIQTRNFTLIKPYVFHVDLPSVDTGTYFYQVYQK